jgi:hypothetical protein
MPSLGPHFRQFLLYKIFLVLRSHAGQKVTGLQFQSLLETGVQSLINGNSGKFKG